MAHFNGLNSIESQLLIDLTIEQAAIVTGGLSPSAEVTEDTDYLGGEVVGDSEEMYFFRRLSRGIGRVARPVAPIARQ